jgi:hypothetical protein
MEQHDMDFVFGIYPGGVAGGDTGLLTGPPDDPVAIARCLSELQGSAKRLVLRVYDSFQDPDSALAYSPAAPINYSQYAIAETRPLDLVLQYRSSSADISGYLRFVEERVREHCDLLYSVQITEEPNFTDGPDVIDGPYPEVLDAMTRGVIAAKSTLREVGAPLVKVGFNVTPTFGPAQEFWNQLRSVSSTEFMDALDFVGLDFFPDVFRPVSPDGEDGDIASSVEAVLKTMREVWMRQAGIGIATAIHITEHGWPTGPSRSPERQADILNTVIRKVYSLRSELNIERYTLFSLRDVQVYDVKGPYDIFRYFGIADALYKRKPAFERFRTLIRELNS